MTDPTADALLGGRYRLGAEIGRGGVGRVVEGLDTRLGRRVAVKLLHAAELRHDQLARFRREALAAGSLGHANIVQITDFVAAPPDPPFIVMERLEGESMNQLLIREGTLAIERAAFIASQVLSGLAAAHAAGIVHRDIKPGNVFLTEVAGVRDIVKILDFGVAKLVGDRGSKDFDPRITADSAAVGTPVYMAPEQARGGAISPETDIYAVGVLLYIALTGREPFYAGGYGELVAKILETEPPSIASIRAGVPEALADVVERAMHKTRSARFASAESMRAALAPWASPAAHDSAVRDVATVARFSDAPTEPGDGGRRRETSSQRALPRYSTAFVGRERDLARVRAVLAGGSAFATLVGPGGVGKTRLAVEAAGGIAGSFPGGAWFVELAACRSRDDLARTIVQAFGIPPSTAAPDPIELVADWMSSRDKCLYVLDNVEQLDAAATDALALFRDRASFASFLVTSQRPLGFAREELVEVAPLERDGVSSDAEKLFVALARLPEPSDRERQIVRAIVKSLDGLPLAIELAAARVELLGLEELAARLEDRFKLLRDPRKRGAARHASLENAIEWSWQMLEPDERTALMQCSVFAGGFTLDAAESVVALPDGAALEVLDRIHALRVKSFVRVQGEKNPRFALLESIRAYARDRLAESSERAAVEERHAAYYLERGRRIADDVHGPRAVRALEWLASEIENLLEIVRRATADPTKGDAAVAAMRIAGELFAARGPFQVHVALIDEVLALAPSHPEIGWLLRAKGQALRYLGETAGALVQFDRAVAIGRQQPDKRLVAHALGNRATLMTLDARVDQALMDLDEAISIDRAIGDRRHEGRCIAGRAVVILDNRGDHARAEADFVQALAILREVGDLGYQAHVLGYLASLCSERSEVAEGRRYLEEALEIRRALGNRREIMTLVGQRGIFQDLEGELSPARASYVETIVQARAVADRRYQGYYLYYLARLDLEQGRLEESRRNLDEAIALLERVRDVRYSIFARASSTAERALSGAVADAERELAALRAAHDRMTDDHLRPIVTLAEAFVARARGDGARSLALRSSVDVRASDDVRLLARTFDCTMAIQLPT